MKTKLFRFCTVFLVCGLLLGCIASTVYGADISSFSSENGTDSILFYCRQRSQAENLQQWLDGELTEEAGAGAEWYLLALSQYEQNLDYSVYVTALKSAMENGSFPPATRQKQALALIACGYGNEPIVSEILDETIGQSGLMTWVFGLHLLNNRVPSSAYSAQEVVEKLLSFQLADGGWSVTGNAADADVTAMTLQALAPYSDASSQVAFAIDKATSCLAGMQLEDASFASYGESNAESTAQVLMALTSLSKDPCSDSFTKNGKSVVDALLSFQKEDGSFSHTLGGESSDIATSQVLCALVAMSMEQTNFYFWENGFSHSVTVKEDTHSFFSSYKAVSLLIIVGCALLASLLLYLGKRKNPKNFLFVAAVAILASAFVLFTNFQSKENFYDTSSRGEQIGTVTLSIRCDTVSAQCDAEYIPKDGILLDETEIALFEDDTVYDVLMRAAKEKKLQVENRGVTGINVELAYIAGIQYLYEMDFGDLSGWIYHVNGTAPSCGCGAYFLKDKDAIVWIYSLDLGNDVK